MLQSLTNVQLWNTCHAPDKVPLACQQTLSDLQLDYLDLYLVHHPYAWEFAGLNIAEDTWVKRDDSGNIMYGKGVSLQNTWQAMEELVDSGIVRNIGVSNYSAALLCDLLQYARIHPAVNQCESHVYFSRSKLRSICAGFNVHYSAFSILGSGKVGPLVDPVVCEIADNRGVSPAQILIAWGIAQGGSVLAKSTKSERIISNLAAGDIELDKGELASLDALDQGLVTCNMEEYWQFASHV